MLYSASSVSQIPLCPLPYGRPDSNSGTNRVRRRLQLCRLVDVASTTVRVDIDTRDRINALAEAAGISSAELLERALATYEERTFWSEYQAAVADLRADPEAWAAAQGERAAWDRAIGDGLA